MVTNDIKKFRKARNGRGISIEQLARKVGRTRSFISKLENHQVQPGPVTMFRIAYALDRTIDEIFHYKPAPLL